MVHTAYSGRMTGISVWLPRFQFKAAVARPGRFVLWMGESGVKA